MPASRPAPSWVISDASPWTSVGRADDGRPERHGHGLHPEAHAEQREAALGGDRDALDRDAGVVGVARPGRDDDPAQVRRRVVGELADRRTVHGVVADDPDPGAGGLQCLHEIEGEAVVVVDDQDHGRAPGAALAGQAGCGQGLVGAGPRLLGYPGCEVDRPAERGRLVLGLLELALRDRPGDDTSPRVDVGLAVLEHRAADRDRGVQVAVVAQIPDGAAVQAAPFALRGGDQLHRPDLGRARQRAGREDRPERVERVELGSQAALDVADQVEHVAVALDLHVLADGDRPRTSDAAKVVAAEVDQHHVLGSLLRIGLELLGEERVLAGVRPARPRAGDRVGRQAIALDLEEQLGRGADDLVARGAHEEEIRAGVDSPQRPVQPDPIEGRAGRRVGRQLERLPPGQHDLDRLARRDRVLGHLDRVDVLVAAEAGLDRAADGGLGRGSRRGRGRAVARRAGSSRSAPRRWDARCAPAPRRWLPRRSGSDPRGPVSRCGARRSPRACASGGRRRARDRSR